MLILIGIIAPTIFANAKGINDEKHAAISSFDDRYINGTKSIELKYDEVVDQTFTTRYASSLNDTQQGALQRLEEVELKEELRKTRDDMIALRKSQASKVLDKNMLNSPQSPYLQSYRYVEFDIFQADSVLITDADYDGFYQTFSVIFDADVYSDYAGERARVFADLYLSRDGGPWELLYTTDSFVIEDDSSEDEFEVITTLGTGYETSHYDVLIDLYEVGYSGIVATISSNDVNGLYALPLESADRDEIIVDEYSSSVYVEAGSTSLFVLLILVTMVIYRNTSIRVKF